MSILSLGLLIVAIYIFCRESTKERRVMDIVYEIAHGKRGRALCKMLKFKRRYGRCKELIRLSAMYTQYYKNIQ